ncbi:hypothetical protein RHGRI_012291 [Rhododendron griersonianum]|uniref:Serine protease n=1 Tax=Rhododendron griersonianum TaxID=479676 RepID=A0AAV6KR96_9ERIC|nr:hypothetical protein RHGRI_012291 [Rhododendron griersonianum]
MVKVAKLFNKEVIEKVLRGTVLLCSQFVHKDAILDEGVGTGFLLDRDGHILTCAHVMSILQEFKVGEKKVEHWLPGQVRANFRGEDAYVVDVKSIDIGNDVALLKLPPASLPFSLRFGLVINPRRSPYDFGPGHLARFPHHDEYMDPGMKFLELDMRSAPSFSSGPLATVEGNVIGILHVGIDGLFYQGAKAAYGISSSMITKVLKKMHKRSPVDNVFLHI